MVDLLQNPPLCHRVFELNASQTQTTPFMSHNHTYLLPLDDLLLLQHLHGKHLVGVFLLHLDHCAQHHTLLSALHPKLNLNRTPHYLFRKTLCPPSVSAQSRRVSFYSWRYSPPPATANSSATNTQLYPITIRYTIYDIRYICTLTHSYIPIATRSTRYLYKSAHEHTVICP